jgi:putative chitinase
MLNRKFFFEQARSSLFGGAMTSSQVSGLTAILDAWEASYSKKDDRWLAYALGTTHHETDRKMQPIHEYGGNAYFKHNYDVTGKNPTRAKSMGNTTPGDGVKYHGRGFVQLTWKVNYQKAGTYLSSAHGKTINLVANPDLALVPAYAAGILFHGMMTGMFTGRKFVDFFSLTATGQIGKDDWVKARAIINGTDKANLIATYGKQYYSAISYTNT